MKYHKPYKDDSPENTINNIKGILNGLGIFLSEHHTPHCDGKLHSCNVKIASSGLDELYPGISTNGKGTSIEYAFASAYAEFMERLQNGVLLKRSRAATRRNLDEKEEGLFFKRLQENNSLLEFSYDPDEEIFEAEEYIEKEAELLEALFFTRNVGELKNIIINALGFQSIICVPFYYESEDRVVQLPIELLFHCYGTNGMCAGNSPEEALIHGICEILERYALAEVYYKRMCPPTIPLEAFQDAGIIELVTELKERGLDVTIKDFSLGMGLPVIGVVVVDRERFTYNVKAASDPNPSIALERCLTELHQTSKEIRMNPIQGWRDHQITDQERFLNFKKVRSNSSGHWHKNIFHNSYSYEFRGLNQDLGRKHQIDLQYLKKCIQSLGGSLYIRDVSFLEFNSYYVVVPQLSHIYAKQKEDFVIYHDFYAQKGKLDRVSSLTKIELEGLVLSIEKCCNLDFDFWENEVKSTFVANTNRDLALLNQHLFLSMAYYKLDDLKKSIVHLDAFLQVLNEPETVLFKYYFACRDYFLLKQEGASNSKIAYVLNTFYEGDIAKEVVDDLSDTEQIFQYQELPSCYECEACKIARDCKFFDVIKILKKVQSSQLDKPIDQKKVGGFL